MKVFRNQRVWTRVGAAAAAAICAAASLSIASPATAARSADPGVSVEVLAAMQRDLGLTEQQARQRVTQQTVALVIDHKVRAQLGASYGGSWFDPASGQLNVGVTAASAAPVVAGLGARSYVVARSWAQLEAIVGELDALAGKGAAKAGTRALAGKRQAAVDGLASWYIDPKLNRVVVSAVDGKPSRAALDNLSRYGDAVQLAHLPAAPTKAADFMDGGDIINLPGGGFCSAGFNLRNPGTGQGYLLIAGHCVSAGQVVSGQGGTAFGTVLESWFPTYDDAIIQATNPGFWFQGHWVDINPPNGGFITITGFTDAPVGTAVCKSGHTTKRTCGTITAKRETVTFDGINTVFDLTRHSACLEKGDSGGSNYVPGSPNTAEGVSSGAVLYGATLRCGAAVGQPTISWYYPFALSIGYYGAVYGVSLWP